MYHNISGSMFYSKSTDLLKSFIRGTFKSKAPLRVQFSPALGGRGWERVKAEAKDFSRRVPVLMV